MVRYPNKVIELIKQLPEGHSGVKKLIKKNYKIIDIDKLKSFDIKDDLPELQEFYNLVIEEILSSNPEALELLKILSVINTEVGTNIDRNSIETCCEIPNVENAMNALINTGIIKNKEKEKETYEFSFQEIQDTLMALTDEKHHEKAIQYYKKKSKKYKGDLYDDIEIIFHKAMINPSEELVNEFLTIANSIGEFDYRHRRLIDIARELLILEDKFKAPILIILGNILSTIGDPKDAERIYFNALELYKDLAKKYYRIYLPYIAAIQKNLGTLYTDLKRFEEAEKIYNEALSSYKELEKQYYGAHSPDFHSKEYSGVEKSYIDDLKAYNDMLKRFYDIYSPEEPSITSDYGHIGFDLDLLEDIPDDSIKSLDTYKSLAKVYYDMYLIDIAKTQSNLGLIYSELGKFDEAEQMHLEALKIKKKIADHYPDQVLPELVLTLIDLGDLYAVLNRFEDAEPMFNEALKISKQLALQNPEVYLFNVALIHNSLGLVYTRLKKFEEAEQKFLDALEIFKQFAREDPKSYLYNVADIQNNLGNLFLKLRNLEKAESFLIKALKNDPASIEVLYNLSCLESLKKNQAKALELLAKVVELDGNYIERAKVDDCFKNIKDLKEFLELIGE